jgi:hypothetical protein
MDNKLDALMVCYVNICTIYTSYGILNLGVDTHLTAFK